MTFKRKLIALLLACSACTGAGAQQDREAARKKWVDSVYNRLGEEERIGQLFMVAAYSGGPKYNDTLITRLIRNHQVGGLIFMQGGPVRQAMLTNKYQRMAQVPLLLAMDAEWGLGMRLDSVVNFPRQMMLGAADDTALMYRMGMAIAYQCRRLGVHIDFAPDVDVNNNPNNPVINARSFGEDKMKVVRLGIAYMKGLQDNGVMACAKHFPGHGDTDADSHKDLPVINKSQAQLDTLELYPFRALIRAGVQSVMVAHLEVPVLEKEAHTPTTLSKNTVTGLLKEKMGYKGLVFTDALNMQGVAKYFPPGEVDVRAFIAGNDVLLFSQDVPVAIARIKEALKAKKIGKGSLEQSVKKILGAKYDAGLHRWQPVDATNVTADLNTYTLPLRQAITEASVTLVNDDNGILRKIRQRGARVAYVGVNATSSYALQQLQDSLGSIRAWWLPKGSSSAQVSTVLNDLGNYDAVVVGVHSLNIYPGDGGYGLDAQQLGFLREAQSRNPVMIAVFGNAYVLKNACAAKSVLVTYEGDSVAERVAADILLGRRRAVGALPVTPCAGMKSTSQGTGFIQGIPAPTRPFIIPASMPYQLRLATYSEAGVPNPDALGRLDNFINRCIGQAAFPGCRILAAKDGKVFYDQAFGALTYDRKTPVARQTLYDVASMTKVLSTTLAVMKLYEDGKLNLDKTLGDYLAWTRETNKGALKVRDVLLHQAGMVAYIPFWKETLDSLGNLSDSLYRVQSEKGFRIPVARDLFLRNDYPDTMWSQILVSPLDNRGRYVYSDNDFYFLWAIVEKLSKKSLDEYVHEQFYKPMGLQRTLYNPLKKFREDEIAPTENDMTFRHRLVQGYVHDQGAAMMGGVAGHAGLFATANDVAAVFQMLLNRGQYKDKRYFRPETVDLFAAYNSTISRRGLGFDKPNPSSDASATSDRCSGYTFGHQGFTGTCAWADPATGIIFVFLSNRVYPSADNNLINRLSVRTVAQDFIYEAFNIPANKDRSIVQRLQLNETGK